MRGRGGEAGLSPPGPGWGLHPSPAGPRPEAPLRLTVERNSGLASTRGTQQRSRAHGEAGDSEQTDRQLERHLAGQTDVGVQIQEGGS